MVRYVDSGSYNLSNLSLDQSLCVVGKRTADIPENEGLSSAAQRAIRGPTAMTPTHSLWL